MASRVLLNDPAAFPLRPNLDVLVRNLDRDTVRCKRVIRQFLEDDREEFLRAAMAVLKKQADSPGAQYLIALLVESGLLLPLLTDPAVSKESALEMARVAIAYDPMTDVTLGRTMAQSLAKSDESLNDDQIGRVLEILGEISDGARIFPSLVRLLRHGNPNVRSKAVLMIGRGNRSTKWVKYRLSDADSRIRANALESLWGVNTDEARQLLQSLVHDPNNRVAGNAILGLYRLGDSSVIPELMDMAHHESAMFRATAAWVMGESGDPRFTEVLAVLLRDPNAVLRKRAFSALGSIRAAIARMGQASPCRLAARFADVDGQKGQRRLMLAVASEGKGNPPGVLPTQILLWEDAQMVTAYRVAERPLPETNSMVFIMPLPRAGAQSCSAAALECLPWKRPSDLWACSYYTADPQDPSAEEVQTRFQSTPEAVAAEFVRAPNPGLCQDLWHTIWRAVEYGAILGKRQLIVFSDGETRSGAGSELISAVAAARAGVQVITSGPDPRVEDFCRKVNGVLWHRTLTVDAYVSLSAKYEIVYQPPAGDAQTLKIRVNAPGARGDLTIPIPRSEPRP